MQPVALARADAQRLGAADGGGRGSPRILRGLDIGAHDFLLRPIDRNELLARVRTQVRRKRFTERLRDSVQSSMEMAVTDQLTGLHNRRFMDSRLAMMFDESALRARSLAILLLDIDYFKVVNDSWGHDAGDEVLREFADRVRACTRGIDLVARLGGEEVVVVLPDTGRDAASYVAERIRERVENEPFAIQNGTRSIRITVSVGVAYRRAGDASAADIMKRADDALYRAKAGGRNRVIVANAAERIPPRRKCAEPNHWNVPLCGEVRNFSRWLRVSRAPSRRCIVVLSPWILPKKGFRFPARWHDAYRPGNNCILRRVI